jgi:hypothetical protein
MLRLLFVALAVTLSTAACSSTPPLRRGSPNGAAGGQAGAAGGADANETPDVGDENDAGDEKGAAGAGGRALSEDERAALALQVKDILKTNCWLQCHDAADSGGGNAKGRFGDVLSVPGMIRGDPEHNDEPRLKPGDPDGSELWRQVRGNRMPKSSVPLNNEEKTALKLWIEVGAPDWADYEGGDD